MDVWCGAYVSGDELLAKVADGLGQDVGWKDAVSIWAISHLNYMFQNSKKNRVSMRCWIYSVCTLSVLGNIIDELGRRIWNWQAWLPCAIAS